MWMPDGLATVAKIGVLTPHLDPVSETELQVMAPKEYPSIRLVFHLEWLILTETLFQR